MHVPFTRDLPSIPLLTAGLHGTSSRFRLIRTITVYQGTIYHGEENGYAKTGIVDFPEEILCSCVLLFYVHG